MLRLGHAVAGELAPGADGRVHAGGDAAPRVRPADAGGGHDRPARSTKPAGASPAGAISRQLHAAIGQGAGRRRAGDSAVESARLFHAHPMPGLRPRGAVPALRHRPDAPSHGGDRPVPLLRLRGARRPTCVPDVRLRGHPLQRAGHAAAGGRGPGPLSQRRLPAHGHRHHARPRQPRAGAGGVPLGQGAASCWARR